MLDFFVLMCVYVAGGSGMFAALVDVLYTLSFIFITRL